MDPEEMAKPGDRFNTRGSGLTIWGPQTWGEQSQTLACIRHPHSSDMAMNVVSTIYWLHSHISSMLPTIREFDCCGKISGGNPFMNSFSNVVRWYDLIISAASAQHCLVPGVLRPSKMSRTAWNEHPQCHPRTICGCLFTLRWQQLIQPAIRGGKTLTDFAGDQILCQTTPRCIRCIRNGPNSWDFPAMTEGTWPTSDPGEGASCWLQDSCGLI